MINLSFDVTDADLKKLQAELLIQILAAQRATIALMVHMLKVDDNDRDNLLKTYRDKVCLFTDEIMEDLYAKFAITNVNDIIGSNTVASENNTGDYSQAQNKEQL